MISEKEGMTLTRLRTGLIRLTGGHLLVHGDHYAAHNYRLKLLYIDRMRAISAKHNKVGPVRKLKKKTFKAQ